MKRGGRVASLGGPRRARPTSRYPARSGGYLCVGAPRRIPSFVAPGRLDRGGSLLRNQWFSDFRPPVQRLQGSRRDRPEELLYPPWPEDLSCLLSAPRFHADCDLGGAPALRPASDSGGGSVPSELCGWILAAHLVAGGGRAFLYRAPVAADLDDPPR